MQWNLDITRAKGLETEFIRYDEVLFHLFYSHDWGKENESLN